MIPCLFNANERTFNNGNNGLGKLIDVIYCKVTEERNGQYELELSYPIESELSKYLIIDNIILAKPAADAENQPFVIYKTQKTLDGHMIVNAHHISYLTKKFVVLPFSNKTGFTNTINSIRTRLIPQSHLQLFAFVNDGISETVVFNAMDKPYTLREYMGGVEGSLLDTFGGEWEFDKFRCILHKSRGSDRGVTIKYGVNLKSLDYTVDSTDAYTHWCYYFTKSDGTIGYQDTDNQKNLHDSYRFQDSEGNWIDYAYPKVRLIDVTELYNKNGNKLSWTNVSKYLKDTYTEDWKPRLTGLTVDFINLRDTEEYKDYEDLQNVHLCDTVTVEHEEWGLKATQKVIKTVYDCVNERYDEITLQAKRVELFDVFQAKYENKVVNPYKAEIQDS